MEQELSQIVEKEAENAAEKAVEKAAEKGALDRRFGTIEAQLQTFITKFGQNITISIPVDFLESRDPISTTDSKITTPFGQSVPSRPELGYMLKPLTFDGKLSWEEYKI